LKSGQIVARLAIVAFFLLALLALVVSASRGTLGAEPLIQLLAFGTFAVVGFIVVQRAGGHRIGWLCLAIALGGVLIGVGQEYSRYAEAVGSAAGARLAASLALIGFPGVGLAFTFLPLLFPDGRLPSRRWTPVAVLAVVDIALLIAAFGLTPTGWLGTSSNPIAVIPAGSFADALGSLAGIVTMLTGVLCAGALLVRYRDGSPEQRQQLKWVAAAFVVFAVSLVVSVLLPPLDTFAITLPILPISVGIAVLRYRLYDIDLIINRALVYIPLTGLLGGLYAASVALFQRLFVALTGDRSDAAVVITTLIVAGVFTPARKSLEAAVDRRFKPAHQGRMGIEGVRTALDPALREEVEAIARRVVEERLAKRSEGLRAGSGGGVAAGAGAGYHLGTSIPVEEAEGVMDKKAKVPKKPKQGKAKGPVGK
jgi:hypothetical protein